MFINDAALRTLHIENSIDITGPMPEISNDLSPMIWLVRKGCRAVLYLSLYFVCVGDNPNSRYLL